MRWPVAIGIGFVGLLGTLVVSEAFGLRVNLSASMPVGLYRLAPCGEGVGEEVGLGDLVAVDTDAAARSNPKLRFFWERGYLTFTGDPRDLLLKEVSGLGGDLVEDWGGRLRVGGRALNRVASFRSAMARGEPLPQVSFPYRLPPGELWLSSDHLRGIDSRYFGGVSKSAIACRAEALWTR
jgi:type IV secretory pathway protease TraF